jgi:hypothetical protein
MDRFFYGFATLFAFAFGMFHEGRGESGGTRQVTLAGKATLETDG